MPKTANNVKSLYSIIYTPLSSLLIKSAELGIFLYAKHIVLNAFFAIPSIASSTTLKLILVTPLDFE